MQIRKTVAQPVYWLGEASACDLCGKPLGQKMIDGRTNRSGAWALMDLACHRVHGAGLGTGKGQLYARQEDGRWLKIEG